MTRGAVMHEVAVDGGKWRCSIFMNKQAKILEDIKIKGRTVEYEQRTVYGWDVAYLYLLI